MLVSAKRDFKRIMSAKHEHCTIIDSQVIGNLRYLQKYVKGQGQGHKVKYVGMVVKVLP